MDSNQGHRNTDRLESEGRMYQQQVLSGTQELRKRHQQTLEIQCPHGEIRATVFLESFSGELRCRSLYNKLRGSRGQLNAKFEVGRHLRVGDLEDNTWA